ncbi:hypothetical protein F4001_09155 [Candidatus Poribacteria bacterium]|nr:hypothetical protein [Candidatus Poribacteria bacterium]
MRYKLYWGLGILIVLLIGAFTFVMVNEHAEDLQFESELKEAQELADQIKAQQKLKEESPNSISDTPIDASAEETSIEHTSGLDVLNSEKTKTEQTAMPLATDEVRVSKFGFGPYPELPADFPYQDLFDASTLDNVHDPDNPNYELMYRVRVKLWKQGVRDVLGMSTSRRTGLFYPSIPGTIYVEWVPRWTVFGQEFGRKIRSVKGNPDDMEVLRDGSEDGRPLLESDIPSHLKVLDMSEGIDPYDFLDLPKPK